MTLTGLLIACCCDSMRMRMASLSSRVGPFCCSLGRPGVRFIKFLGVAPTLGSSLELSSFSVSRWSVDGTGAEL